MAEEKDSGILTIVLIVLGAAVIFQIFKSSSQTKQMQQQVQQIQQAQQKIASNSINSIYENDEKWQIERGDNGHIIDLRVVRNARVTNSDTLSSDGAHNPSGLPSLHVPDAERVIKPVEPGRIQQDRIAEMARVTRMNESYRRQHFGMV